MLVAGGCRDQATSAGERSDGSGRSANDWRQLYDQWEYPAPIPDFQLIDQDRRELRLSRLDPGYVLMSFIYTRCPVAEACPLTTSKMHAVQRAWKALPPGQRPGLTLLSITLDPGFDTPERLRAHALARGADLDGWIFATGPEELVANALPSLVNVLALPRGPADIQHTLKIVLMAPGRVIIREWTDNELSPDQVIDLIISRDSERTGASAAGK